MAYARDELYNKVIRRKLGKLATRINVRQILNHLSTCLTLSDVEEIEAKRDYSGNYGAVSLLFQNLQRRDNWPEVLITALRNCEYFDLATEISEAYDRIRGNHNHVPPDAAASHSSAAPPAPAPAAVIDPAPSPAETSATVATAEIHNAPHSTPTVPTPSVSEASASSDTPSPMSCPPGPHSNVADPASTEAPALVSAPDCPIQPPPESTPPAEPTPDMMPPSPVSAPKVTPSVQQSEVPVCSRENHNLGISDGPTNTALPGPSTVAAPSLPTDPANAFDNSAITSTLTEVSNAVERSSLAKHPIQDTNPPVPVVAQDSQNNPTVNEVVEHVHAAVSPNNQTQETSPDAIASGLSNFAAENEENFSKPGVLTDFSGSIDSLQISCMATNRSPTQAARPQAVSNPHRAEEPVNEPVSVSTDDLMISPLTTIVPSQYVSDPLTLVHNSIPREQENCLAERDSNSYPHQPMEDHYESSCQSFQTIEHIVHFSEEPSVQNVNGQPQSMDGQIIRGLSSSGEPSHHTFTQQQANNASEQAIPGARLGTYLEPAQDTLQESILNSTGQINIPLSEQREENQGIFHQFQSNAHLVVAAAVGMTAIFVALRLRH